MSLTVARSVPPFRFEPPRAPEWTLVRPRLITLLAERFETRLIVITGGGGFGKTTLLAQAIRENQLSPVGRDAWLRIIEHDRAADHLVAGLARSLHGPGATLPTEPRLDDVLDAAWALAPERVALVVDDTHRLGDSTEAWNVIGRLIDELPTNASVVLSGRQRPTIELARLRGGGDLVEIDEGALGYTASEAAQVAERLGADTASGLATWPALTTLQCRGGQRFGIDYLWEQVIQQLPPDRRELLATAAPFSSITDKLLSAIVPGSGTTAAELVRGLPLVETVDERSFRLHDLWGAALADVVPVGRRRAAAALAGEHLLEIGELIPAAEAFALAGDHGRLAEVVRREATRAIGSSVDTAQAAALLDILPEPLSNGSSGALLRAARLFATQPNLCLEAYRRALVIAEEAGNDEDAVVAYWRLAQFASAAHPHDLEIEPRLQELADAGHRLARSACAMLRSNAAAMRGDVEAALAEIDQYEIDDPAAARGSETSRYLSLGRPELVPASLDSVLGEGIADPLAAQAVWFRGEISPDLAWPIARDLPSQYERRNTLVVQMPLVSIVSQIAGAAGDLVAADRLSSAALDLAQNAFVGDRLYAQAARVMYLAALGDEAGAEALIVTMAAQLEPLPFPDWPYMGMLCPLRAFGHDVDGLDEVSLGPTMRTAVAAGAAIRALRDRDDVEPARRLPWSQIDLLRVHVPPPLLTELAVAASDLPDARAALAETPRAAQWLHRIAARGHGSEVRTRALGLTTQFVLRPTEPLQVTTFGRLRVNAPDGTTLVGDQSRGRVRELFASLLIAGSARRSDLAEQMWPDHDPAKARDNLRATLAHLVKALTVDGQPPYLEAGDQAVALPRAYLDLDVDRFDTAYRDALFADRESNPSVALQHYLTAVGLAVGSYLPESEHEDVRFERLRLDTLATTATCRAAELLLAKGEPEWALELATKALSKDPLSERAARTAVSANVALGSVTGAQLVAKTLVAELADAGITPSQETVTACTRLGLRP